jgi:hypothetical protein
LFPIWVVEPLTRSEPVIVWVPLREFEPVVIKEPVWHEVKSKQLFNVPEPEIFKDPDIIELPDVINPDEFIDKVDIV